MTLSYFNGSTWVGELHIQTAIHQAVASGNIGDKHVWEGCVALEDLVGGVGLGAVEVIVGWDVSSLRATGDSDRSAVHVELAVADFVEPCPSECVVAGRDARRDLVCKFCRCHGGRIVTREVPVYVGWAATHNGVNDHPFRGLGWLEVFGERDLAGSAAVNGGAVEGEGLWRANSHDVLGSRRVVYTRTLLAGEVAAGGLQGTVVDGGGSVRSRSPHHHVSIGG